jgi:GxxExxY protein
MTENEINDLSYEIIGWAMEVHKVLGPGLLESAYGRAFAHELDLNKINYVNQKDISVKYKGLIIDNAYKADFIIEDEIVVELKTVAKLVNIHSAQLLTYLKFTDKKLGLLINFNVLVLKDGITRVVNNL